MITAMSITPTDTPTPIPILTPGSEEDVLTPWALAEAEAETTLEEAFETVVEVTEAVVDVTLSEELAEELLPVGEAVRVPVVAVPVAPLIPKFGEKLKLVGSVSSMISIVYWKLLRSSAEGI